MNAKEQLEDLIKARAKARPFEYNSSPNAENHEYIQEGSFECPMCEGQGGVEGTQHINLGGEVHVMNVLFSGIGDDMINWREFLDKAANFATTAAPQLLERIRTLEEALGFYADPENWSERWDKQFSKWLTTAADLGRSARQALEDKT